MDLNYVLITAPVVEPITRQFVKEHSRVEIDDEDDQIDLYIQAAREQAENTECWIQLMAATWELRLDRFPSDGSPILLPRPPLMDVISIKYIDTDGVLQTLSDSSVSPAITSTLYTVDLKSPTHPEPGEIHLAYGESWPSTRAEHNAIRIRYRAGFAEASGSPPETPSPSLLPGGVLQWIAIAAATSYADRESRIVGTIVAELDFIAGLLDPWRAKRFV